MERRLQSLDLEHSVAGTSAKKAACVHHAVAWNRCCAGAFKLPEHALLSTVASSMRRAVPHPPTARPRPPCCSIYRYSKGQRFGRHIDDSNELGGGRYTQARRERKKEINK